MGLEEKAVLQKVFPQSSPEEHKELARLITSKQDEHLPKAGGKLYPGVKEGLEKLNQKYKLFIVSNCPENTVNDFITWAGIKYCLLITKRMAVQENQKRKILN